MSSTVKFVCRQNGDSVKRGMPILAFAIATITMTTAMNSTCIAYANDDLAQAGDLTQAVVTAEAPVVNIKTDAQTYDVTLQLGKLSKGARYDLIGAPYTDENRKQFEQLSEGDQKKFLERRELYLKKVAGILHYTKLIYGSGSLTFNKIKIVAKPFLALIKSSMITAYNKSKGFLLIAKSKFTPLTIKDKKRGKVIEEAIAKEAVEATPEATDGDASIRPAMTVSARAFSFAKNLILQSNQKLKKFNNWLLNKVYADLPPHLLPGYAGHLVGPSDNSVADVALPIQELAVTSLGQEIHHEQPTLLARIRERSEIIILKLLQRFDQALWERSRFIVSHNEAVVVLSFNVIGLSGVGSQVSGGLPQGIGFKFGINWQSQALVFEVYHETETLIYALTPSSSYGLTPKLGFAIISQDLNNEIGSRIGYYAYPASPPGAMFSPGYTAVFRDSVSMGFTTNLLTAPFSAVGDFFWYNTYAAQRPIVRLTLSPKSMGFLRVKFISFKAPSATVNEIADDQFALPVKLIADSLNTEADSPPVVADTTSTTSTSTCAKLLGRAD